MLKIALVGRPNVGKSTLFNRLVRLNKAIVNNIPGVTRDRKYGQASLVDLNFILIDTAGIDETLNSKTDTEIRHQTELAIEDSDIIIFVIDARVGVLPVEKTFSKKLIKLNNKCLVRGLYEWVMIDSIFLHCFVLRALMRNYENRKKKVFLIAFFIYITFAEKVMTFSET